MVAGPVLVKFRKPTGPLLLVSIPLFVLTLASVAAPMLASPARLATSAMLGALSLSFAAIGWPQRRRIMVDENGAVFDVDLRRPVLQRVVALGVTALESSGSFSLVASGCSDERVVLFADEDPGKVLSVGTRLSSRLGLPIDVPLLAASRSCPSCWRIAQSTRIPETDVMRHVPGMPRPVLWLACAGGVFVLGVLASMTHTHCQRHAAFSPASMVLAAFLSGIAVWLLHLGLMTRYWRDEGFSSDATACKDYRCGTWSLLGRRVLAVWNDRAPPLGLISAASDAIWLVFLDDQARIRTSRVSFAGPLAGHRSDSLRPM
ncbi:MAG TPA: hypothetical protein VIV60_02310 [Polyangiaceae bacterium]